MKEKLVFFREAICNNQVEIWTLLLDCPGTSSTYTNLSSQKLILVLVSTASAVPELLASILSTDTMFSTHCTVYSFTDNSINFNFEQ